MSSQNDGKYDFPLNPRRSMYFQDLSVDLKDILLLLNTPSSQRPPIAIRTLQNLTRNIPFFKQLINDYEERAHIECCMYLKHLFLEKNSIVCKAGDVGEYFYIILHGNVKVVAPDEGGRKFSECTILMAGCAFGEYALLKNRPRSATVVCVDDSHFAVLSKKDFIRILGTFTNRKFDEIARFLKSLPLFAGWGLNSLVRLGYYFRPIRFKRNQKVFSEGEPSEFVYIIKKGEVEMSKGIIVKTPSQVVIGNHGRPLPSVKKSQIHTSGRIAIVGFGEIIGDDDALNGEFYTKTCRCYSSNAEMLQISSFEFRKRIRSEESLSILAEKNAFRNRHQDFTVSIIQQIQSPTGRVMRTKTSQEQKFISDIKALNPWNSSMKAIRSTFPGMVLSHRPSLSLISPIYKDKVLSPKFGDAAKF